LSIITNSALFALSLLCTIISIELSLRALNIGSVYVWGKEGDICAVAKELEWMRTRSNCYACDRLLGFKPVFGASKYGKYGTIINNYKLRKKPGVVRLLFIGDSVTEAGTIIKGLRHFYGDEKYEYWNAGVGSYNTAQEVNYYKTYNYKISPDHVILTFHLNDFETTPVVFFDEKKKLLMVYAPIIEKRYINTFMFKNSYLYRYLLSKIIFLSTGSKKNVYSITIDTIGGEIKTKLAELKRHLNKNNIKLTVLIHPTLDEYSKYNYTDRKALAKIKSILKELNIRRFDLSKVLDKAIKDDINMRAWDKWHPSDTMGLYFAEYLYNNNLLQ
jgi:hypothetical protein